MKADKEPLEKGVLDRAPGKQFGGRFTSCQPPTVTGGCSGHARRHSDGASADPPTAKPAQFLKSVAGARSATKSPTRPMTDLYLPRFRNGFVRRWSIDNFLRPPVGEFAHSDLIAAGRWHLLAVEQTRFRSSESRASCQRSRSDSNRSNMAPERWRKPGQAVRRG